ncbi:hypothetical protein N836_15250 [Leptolyngbya sp. Heron Island J]|uniref:hypothetical protein n=1 Tax=Leptolyngbya sp. Heron Island J TaxID=1385935 RepID=UPI0003B963FE|nr:hypothetical protein [Leptolyngbya sp. Heron Island J]ESA34774.1 hypothetical protein N836_15250 [Leptolyngbya sp. Heron Island J]
MLKILDPSEADTVKCLVNMWVGRYFPNLTTLPEDFYHHRQLLNTVSKQGRTYTAHKLKQPVIDQACSLAAVRTRDLYSHHGASYFKETANLAKITSRIYERLLEIYQETTSVVSSSQKNQENLLLDSSLAIWGIPTIGEVVTALSPFLKELQDWHSHAKNWQSAGFITTQITLSNAILLERLDPVEQVFLNCYFNFLEEQVALPWQRMCSAAADHSSNSPLFKLVERLLPSTREISVATYNKWKHVFPIYYGNRGAIEHPATRHSSIRDFDMFQVYLWISLLEGNFILIEQELLTLCAIVNSTLKIPWDMTADGTVLLINEILSRLETDEKNRVRPYAQGMINAFMRK